jgi:S-DNA-T family DNA segregation ATPase FtsK/SpoIIIE
MIWPSSSQLLPASVKSFFRKSLSEMMGLALVGGALWLAVALWGYVPDDPSLNTASSLAVKHWLGPWASMAADALFQSFGLASFLGILVVGVWGLLLMHAHALKISTTRVLTLVVAIVMLGFFFIGVPLLYTGGEVVSRTSNWGKIPCVGGVLSYLLILNWERLLRSLHLGFLLKPSVVMAFGVAVLTGWYSSGLSFQMLGRGFTGAYNLFAWSMLWLGEAFYTLYLKVTRQKSTALMGEDRQNDASLFAPHLTMDSPAGEDASHMTEEESHTPEMEEAFAIASDQFFADMEGATSEPNPHGGEASPKPRSRPHSHMSEAIYSSDEYQLPRVDLLDLPSKRAARTTTADQMHEHAKQLESVLEEFGIRGEIVNVRPGPVVTMFELKPAPGIKTSRVIGLADDIARSMSALSARIAVISGQNVIGIELPNPQRQTVFMRDLLCAEDYASARASLPLILGQDIGGTPTIADLVRMPHLLVAGTTGSGKSVSVNAMILSLLFKLPPEQCKFIMIDPKMLELSIYDGIPHLLTPVVTDPKKAVVALKWAVKEMENRYRAMSKLGVRNIDGFNTRLKEARRSGEVLMRRVQTGFDPDTGKPIFENQTLDFTPLPYIVVVVDEMADLMLVAGKDIEAAVQRLAQMARAAGIHLIMATQRPSVDVITGTIKANFPTRISFQVTSKIDSRTILGEQGAEQLLGQGDMLYMAGGGRITRVHGPFVKDEEVERIVRFLKAQGEPTYIESVTQDEDEAAASGSFDGSDGKDDLYNQALEIIRREGKASTSFIQRHLQIGYNRAARIIDQLEKDGVLSQANHVGKREIVG